MFFGFGQDIITNTKPGVTQLAEADLQVTSLSPGKKMIAKKKKS